MRTPLRLTLSWIILTSDAPDGQTRTHNNPSTLNFLCRSTTLTTGQRQYDEQIDQAAKATGGHQLVHPGNNRTATPRIRHSKCITPKAYSMFRISSHPRKRRAWSNRWTIAGLNCQIVAFSISAVPVSSSCSSSFIFVNLFFHTITN